MTIRPFRTARNAVTRLAVFGTAGGLAFPAGGLAAPPDFEPRDVVPLQGEPAFMDGIDIDSNGVPDVAIAVDFERIQVLVNDGSGGLTHGQSLAIPNEGPLDALESFVAADLDADGDDDLAILRQLSASSEFVILTSMNDDGQLGAPVFVDQFGACATAEADVTGLYRGSSILEAAEVSGDGFCDLLIGDSNGQRVYRNHGDGSFTPDVLDGVTLCPIYEVADLNGDDAALDAVGLGRFTAATGVDLYLNDGHGLLSLSGGANSPAGADFTAALRDFDGDDDVDLAVAVAVGGANEDDVIAIYTNDGAGAFTHREQHTFPGIATKVAACDLDGDAVPDLVLSSCDTFSSSEGLHILMGRGGAAFDAPVTTDGCFRHLLARDMNGDNKIDLVFLTSIGNQDEVQVHLNLGTAPCPGDTNRDGLVGFDDLLAVLSNWGPCDVPCPEDIEGSGVVGFGDLLAVLSTWGPC